MKSRRAIGVMTLALALTLATLPDRRVQAAEPACPTNADLEILPACGTIALSGESSGYVRVAVPDGSEFRKSEIAIEGQGVLPGVVLTPDPPYLTAPDCGTVDGQIIQLCPNPAGDFYLRVLLPDGFGEPRRVVDLPSSCGSPCVLEGGTYRLYLLTGGLPASVTVRFPGLDGMVETSPRTEVHTDSRVPEASLLPSGSPVYGAGFTDTLQSPGLQFAASGAFNVMSAANVAGICKYLGDPGDPRLAYQPGCPGFVTGDADVIIGEGQVILPLDRATITYGYAYPFRQGRNGIGGYTTVGGVPIRSEVVALQLSFDE